MKFFAMLRRYNSHRAEVEKAGYLPKWFDSEFMKALQTQEKSLFGQNYGSLTATFPAKPS